MYNKGGKIDLYNSYFYLDSNFYNYFHNYLYSFYKHDKNIFIYNPKIFEIISITNNNIWACTCFNDWRSEDPIIETLLNSLVNYESYSEKINKNIFCLSILELIMISNSKYNTNYIGETNILSILYSRIDKIEKNNIMKINLEEIQMKAIRLLCFNKKIRKYFYKLYDEYIEYGIFTIKLNNISFKILYSTYNTIMFMYKNRYIKVLEYKKLIRILSNMINIFLNKFLVNKNSRKFLSYLLQQNNEIRKELLKNFPEIIFELCKKRERKILKKIIELELNTIKKLKYNTTGDTIYSFALKQRGCMNNIINDLKQFGLNK